MSSFDELMKDLKQMRDELRLQIHLASKEAKEEWEELEDKMEDFSTRAKKFSDDAKLKETGEGLNEALGQVGQELKKGYQRLRKAMKD